MKVLLLNTSDASGGASQACNRLYRALQQAGIEAQFWVNEKKGSSKDISCFTENIFQKTVSEINFASEKISLYPQLKDWRDMFFFSPANFGRDISAHPAVQRADVIHLHWINHGFLSLDAIRKLAGLGKKIVWTLHDMWAFTGGCHYSRGCEAYKANCGKCPYLGAKSTNDLSSRIWKKKSSVYVKDVFSFVTCSQWLASIASQSALLSGFDIRPIPNPIDADIFKPIDKKIARENLGLAHDKFYILFASQNLADERKGFRYLREALEILVQKNPDARNHIELVVFGKTKVDLQNLLPLKLHPLGSLSSLEQITMAYNAANLFVLPSLEDNLPNTVMESLSCGVPVAAFNTGGIPEMVDHGSNGFLATQRSADELAMGISKIIWNETPCNTLSENARRKVLDNYTFDRIAKKYIEVYQGSALLP